MITLHAFGRTAALTDRSLPALGSNERIFIDSRGCATTSEQRKKLIIFSQMIDRCSSLFVYTEVPSHQPILTTGCSLQTSSSIHTEHRGDLPGLRTRLDFTLLAQDSELADKYNVTISNAFAALGHLSHDPESAWEQVRDTIVTTAKAVVPAQRSKHRPWLTPETLDIIDQKRDARLTDKRDEHRRLKGIYKAKAKADLDEFYNLLADEAETGFRENNLRPAFRAIKRLKGKQDNDNVLTTPVTRIDGSICQPTVYLYRRLAIMA